VVHARAAQQHRFAFYPQAVARVHGGRADTEAQYDVVDGVTAEPHPGGFAAVDCPGFLQAQGGHPHAVRNFVHLLVHVKQDRPVQPRAGVPARVLTRTASTRNTLSCL
jgi:hypothetical protein